MNTEAITVRYRLDNEQADRIARSLIRSNRFLRLSPWLGILVIVIAFGITAWIKSMDADDFMNQLPFLIIGCVLLLERSITKWKFKRKLKKNSVYNRDLIWQITDKQLINESSEAFHSEFSWLMINKAMEFSEGFLLHQNNSIFYWLPSNGFEDLSKISIFRDWLKTNVSNYKNYCHSAQK